MRSRRESGYTASFGGAVRDRKNNTYSHGMTAYLHFPLGREHSKWIVTVGGLYRWDPRTTRACISIGTPISGQRGFVTGPTIMFGEDYFGVSIGAAFTNDNSHGSDHRRIGGFVGVSYAISSK
jgi:hypothetical protein